MRRLVITENFGVVTVVTSAGVRSTGATVESALSKLDLTGFSALTDYGATARLFARIHPTQGPSQIGEGVAGA